MSFAALMVHVDVEHDRNKELNSQSAWPTVSRPPLSGLRVARCGRPSWPGMPD